MVKLFRVWTSTIEEELDFRGEVANGQKTANLFKNDPQVHVPVYYEQYCSKRMIVMEFIEGTKINDEKKISSELNLDPLKVADKLIHIMAKMIFKHGFVHCDAHPGNILVRKTGAGSNFQIVLLDHGMYRQLDREFINNFCHLWISMMEADDKKVKKYA